jgi:hypothetical protein
LRAFNPQDWPVGGGDPLSQWKAARLEFLRLHPWPEIDPVDWLQETVRQIRRASGF